MTFKRTLPLLAGLLLFAFLWTQGPAKAAPADDLIITGVVDGPLSGGVPKAVELYVVNDIPDLSIYGLGSANNGGGSDGEEFTFPNASATAGQFIYVASETTGFNSFFGFNPDYTSGAMSVNGNDAIELFTNGSVSDVFGDINTDGTGQPWEYLDGWTYRVDGTGSDGSTFVLGNWTFSGPNALDGESTNATAATPFPIGTYSQTIVDNPPQVSSTSPADGATNVLVNAPVTVTFSEAVTLSGTVAIICTSGTQNVTPTTADNITFTLPHTDFTTNDACTVTILANQVTDQDGTPDNMAANYSWNFTVTAPLAGVVINEVLADPAGDLTGDANGDGIRDAADDEFVEIVNDTGADMDISGWTLSDGSSIRHTFPANTIIPNRCAIVVFGGGTPTGTFGNTIVQTASSGSLGLNNGGDTVTLNDGATDQAVFTYGSEGGNNQSLTRSPDITGSFVQHSTVGVAGALFSPGTKVNMDNFAGCGGCGAPATFIHDIQGIGSTSPVSGQIHTVEGIIIADMQEETSIAGFYLQEEDSDVDIDPATSEGLFIYDNYIPGDVNVNVGNRVRVTGTVTEFSNLTELNNITAVEICPTATTATAVTLSLPFPNNQYLERFENMLVTVPQTLTVTELYNLGRYGEVLLSGNGRLYIPTQIVDPGTDANAQLAANMLNALLLDDGNLAQNVDPIVHPTPGLTAANTLRGGDSVAGLTGVLTYSWSEYSGANSYRLHPTTTPNFVHANPRTAAPDAVGGTIKVASFNVLNYFNGDGTGGGFPTSRGADTASEFTRQRDKIINAIVTLNADVIGLMEIENDGYGVNSAILDLVNGLNAATAPGTYAFIDPGVSQIGTDEIAVGLIYKTGSVTPSGTAAILDSTVDSSFLDTKNRPTLAQTFSAGGELFTVAVNHLKSKSSPCDDVSDPDTGDGQGNCNITRTNAAIALANWLATDPTSSGDLDFMVLGDLNSYAREDPSMALKNRNFADLYASFQPGSYSYVFGGQFGTLDYAMSSPSLTTQVTGATSWHINADEPRALDYNEEYKSAGQLVSLYADDEYRASDHDPVIVGLNLDSTAVADFSDLDAVYNTAWHTGSGALRLGSLWSADTTHQLGDDDATDDGVSHFTGNWQPGPNGGSLDIIITPDGANNGCLYAWIDWNHDGVFDNSPDAGNLEYIIRAQTGGGGNYSFEVPANEFLPPGTLNSDPSQVYNLRVRLYGACSSGPTGAGIDGEVEDWVIQFSPTAVTLQSLSAASQNNIGLPLLLITFVMLLLGGLLLWRNGRTEQKQADL